MYISNIYEPKSDVSQSKPICATSQRSVTFNHYEVTVSSFIFTENNAKIYDV